MRVCLMIEGQESVSWDEWVAIAKTCEEAGFEGLFRSDHYASVFGILERGSLDAWATLAGLAAVTTRLRLGTMVSPATFRHPSVVARMATTVDHISGGRVEVGIGAGWYELEHQAFGFPFSDLSTRLELFAEQLEIVYRQFTEESFRFHGKHFTLEDCRANPKPLQTPHPPLIVGGAAGRGTVEPAARYATEYNTGFATADACRARRSKLDDACERTGRDPATLPLSLMTAAIVAEDDAVLQQRTARVEAVTGGDSTPEEVRRMIEEASIVGTVDQVVERLKELEAAGVERIMLQHLAHDDLEMVSLIGREVIPRVS
jgi:F420-dependent oxidoreductase-like protein